MDHGQTKVTAKLARYFIIDLGTFIDFEQNKIRDRIGRIFGINWMESTNFAELHDQIPI